MIDSEQLVQRFLDQELSAEERVRFVVRLGRDEALRERVIELEKLVLDVPRSRGRQCQTGSSRA